MASHAKFHLVLLLSIVYASVPGCSSGPDAQLESALSRYESDYVELEDVLPDIRAAIARGANPNVSHRRWTAMDLAIWAGDAKLVRVLLADGAYVNAHDKDGDGFLEAPPLLEVIRYGGGARVEMGRALLSAGADADGHRSEDEPPLTAAAHEGLLELVDVLLEAGANPNGNEQYDQPLVVAAGEGHLAVVERLLEEPVNEASLQGALLSAATGGHLAVYERLLAAGAEMSDESKLLRLAAYSGNPELVERVLEQSPDIKPGPELFRHAAMNLSADDSAQRQRTAQVIERLLAAGFEPGADDLTGPLLYAAVARDAGTLRRLLDFGVSVNAAGDDGKTALIALAGSSPVTDDFNEQSDLIVQLDNRTVELLACADLLLEHGADVNAADNGGRTALMYAVANYRVALAKRLLGAGADVSMTDNRGRTARDILAGNRLHQLDKADAPTRLFLLALGLTSEVMARLQTRAEILLARLEQASK